MSNLMLKLLLLVLKGMTVTFWTESLVSVLLSAAEIRILPRRFKEKIKQETPNPNCILFKI